MRFQIHTFFCAATGYGTISVFGREFTYEWVAYDLMARDGDATKNPSWRELRRARQRDIIHCQALGEARRTIDTYDYTAPERMDHIKTKRLAEVIATLYYGLVPKGEDWGQIQLVRWRESNM